MALSGTVAFRPSVEEIIAEAYDRCGLGAETRTGYQAVSARRSLNLLFSEWANRGINYWAVTQNTLTLADGTTNYTLPVGTIDIIDAVIREDSTDQTINRVTISEYNQIPNKTTKGKPSQYMIDRQYTPVIYFWNVPDKAYTLNYWAMNQLDDITASNQDADIPYRWSDCICAGLASKLSMKYAPQLMQGMKLVYEDEFQRALQEDGSASSTYITPKAYYPGT